MRLLVKQLAPVQEEYNRTFNAVLDSQRLYVRRVWKDIADTVREWEEEMLHLGRS